MATLSSLRPTLLDLARRTDPDGQIAKIVEILHETNEILDDMVWKEGNLPTGNRTTIRSGLPAPTWRKLYGGVQPSKSTTVQITDNTGMLEAYAEADKALVDLANDPAEFRLSEDASHIEGISQELADTLFFGDETTEPEAFTGFGPRFNSLTAENGDNIVEGGGTGVDNRSIWLIVWGDKVHGIIPKNSNAGLQFTDKGQVTIEDIDGSGGRMEAYRSHYRFDAGLTVRDWRFVVRIANIDFSSLDAIWNNGAFGGNNLPDLMFQAMELIPNMNAGRASFYMSRDMRSMLRRQSGSMLGNSVLDVRNEGGVPLMDFHGVPVKRVDALSADEARIT